MVWPEQNRSVADAGALTNVLLTGSNRIGGAVLKSAASHISTRPDGSSAWWMATTGKLIGADHWPISAGPPVFATVMLTTADTLVFPAPSRARALIACAPFEVVRESQVSS